MWCWLALVLGCSCWCFSFVMRIGVLFVNSVVYFGSLFLYIYLVYVLRISVICCLLLDGGFFLCWVVVLILSFCTLVGFDCLVVVLIVCCG